MTRSHFLAAFCAAVALIGGAAPAHAQQADGRARNMVRQALEDYQNLDVDGARNRLQLAVRSCGPTGCSPAMLARVHIAMGVVAVGGQNDNAAGVTEFTTALRLDPNAEPDELLVTPEITAALNQARQATGRGGNTPVNANGGTGGNGGNTGGRTPPGNGGGTPAQPAGASARLLHTPVPEQLENTPLPVYVEAGAAQAARYVVRYRGLGMGSFAELPMARVANGYGVEIPCGQIIQPSIEYYVTAYGDSGATVGAAGAEDQPFRVQVVRTRSHPAPALPSRMPPEQCGEDCPPGVTGPRCHNANANGRGQRQLGDPCTENRQCATGLHCDAGSCATGEREGGGADNPADDHYVFGFDVGGTLGIFALAAGNPAGTVGTYQTRYAEGNYGYVYPIMDGSGNTVYRPATQAEANDQSSPVLSQRQIPTAISDADPSARTSCGYTPPGPAGSQATDFSYNRLRCPSIASAGAGVAAAINVNLRFAPFRGPIGRYFGFALGLRISPDFSAAPASNFRDVYPTALTPLFMPFMAILARVNIGIYNPHARNGFSMYAFVGGGVGQMQVRGPKSALSTADSAHLQGGPGNVNFGLRAEYGFARYGHVALEVGPNFNFPFLLINFDATLLVGAHF